MPTLSLQYYDDAFPSLKEQTKFEESLFNKTKRSNGNVQTFLYTYMCGIPASLYTDEIIMHEGVTAVYKVNVDLFFAVLGAQNENEVHFECYMHYTIIDSRF